jgi:hypothetical protein
MQGTTNVLTYDSSVPKVWTIPRRSTVSMSRALNTALDTVFYDVKALSLQERSELSAYANPEGSVLVVHPGESKQRIRTLAPWEFVQQHGNGTSDIVDAIAVAGVGSSALGTGALARNIADHLGRPVAGVVSGFGMSDLLTEAMGGWFVLGARNALRDSLARLFDMYQLKDHVRDPESHQAMKEHFESTGIDSDRFIYGSPDSATLLYLLSKLGTGIKLVVGHSKGSLSIENALEGWLASCNKTDTPIHSNLCIVTLGAVIRFPPEFQNVHQFIGRIDYLGIMNSRPLVERVVVPNAWHSLNSAMLGHLSVRQALQSLDLKS